MSTIIAVVIFIVDINQLVCSDFTGNDRPAWISLHAKYTVDGFSPNLARDVMHRSAFMLPARAQPLYQQERIYARAA